ncbi:MAG: Rrf2 family transcriptional regulator [Deltaproteobacteria bacterium]|nr:Rrf2 family transcriptional regulator [Deltaproteobacteria bacterium]
MSTKTMDKGVLMLKLSTKGRYGLRAMIDLAHAHGESPVLMGDIAKRQGFSRKYLHALLTSLKDAGLVQARRGAKGGYLLAKEPFEIQVSEIFEALEGKMSIVDCLTETDTCERVDECETRDMWNALNNALIGVLKGTTLADLTKKKPKSGVSRHKSCAVTDRTRGKRMKRGT